MSAPTKFLPTSSAHSLLRPSHVSRIRCLLSSSPSAGNAASTRRSPAATVTTLPEANPRNLPEVWFSFHPSYPLHSTAPRPSPSPAPSSNASNNDPDENKAKLGKTLRILQSRLPNLLHSPLPQEILAPGITLHLFPSTHPHLPAVRGRVAYQAALWTSPIAFNRVPGLGNVSLEILSERMVRKRARQPGARPEQLVVRWRTIGGSSWGIASKFFASASGGGNTGAGRSGRWDGGKPEGQRSSVGSAQGQDEATEFTGLFIFEFDGEGRVLSHTIEHVEEGGQWERGVGAKVVGLTDWLLGGFKNGAREGAEDTPCPAFAARKRGGEWRKKE